MQWEINGVSIEQEEMLEELKHQPLPLGVIVFGADSGLKARVYQLLRRKLGEPLFFDRISLDCYVGQIKMAFKHGRPVIVCMCGDDSIHHGSIQQLANRLKNLGARTIVGVYVKVTRRDDIDFAVLEREADFGYRVYCRQIKKLATDPPALDNFGCAIVVESDDD